MSPLEEPQIYPTPTKTSAKSILIVAVLLICLIISIVFIPKTITFFSKATSTSSNSVTLENSYLFASPVQAQADGQEKIRVSVFLLDGRGLGISNKTVSLSLPSKITSIQIQPITDESGKAIFDLLSNTQGTFNISATVNNQEIPQKLKIVFY
jgi:hypothetical protein